MSGQADVGPGRSLAKAAIDSVRSYIRDQGLRVGDTLPGEGFFAERLGVSRAVMREAFGALAALKLIDVANGRRARVAALDGSVIAASLDHGLSTAQINVADVWDVRRTIEMRTAELAAQHASPSQAARIMQLADSLGQAERGGRETTDHDIAFHLAIAEASGNALFCQIVVSFVPLMRVAIPKAWQTRRTPQQRREIIARHHLLAQAISEHDPEVARQCMSDHFDESIGSLLAAKADERADATFSEVPRNPLVAL